MKLLAASPVVPVGLLPRTLPGDGRGSCPLASS